MPLMPLMPNHAVMTGACPEGQTVSHRALAVFDVSTGPHNVHIIHSSAANPGVVFRQEDALPYDGLLKSKFQSVYKGTATPEEKSCIVGAYGVSEDYFTKHMRTVGCGTNIYIQTADGLRQLAVERTAPKDTPDGGNNPGVYSRAAGGCTGDIQDSQLREMIEEVCLFYRSGGKSYSLNLTRDDKPVSAAIEAAYQHEKELGLSAVYSQVASKIGTPFADLQRNTVEGKILHVKGLTEDVMQTGDDTPPKAFRAVVADDPKNGDLSGIDAILYVNLSHVKAHDIFIGDGERNFEGKPLGRKWLLTAPDFLENNLKAGTMKFSPTPAKVIAQTPRVIGAINNLKL